MKNTLHIKLNKNLRYKDSTVSEAEINYMGIKTQDELIEEMYNEGICADREEIKKIICAFNEKSASYALNGYTVHTGLVKISATIRGLIHNKIWTKSINRIEIRSESDEALHNATKQCCIEIERLTDEDTSESDDNPSDENYDKYPENIFPNNETPACGIVFRQWLWKSM